MISMSSAVDERAEGILGRGKGKCKIMEVGIN